MAQQNVIAILNDSSVLAELKQAWQDSQPGLSGGREEGGFILGDAAGRMGVERWGKGTQATIRLPLHRNCQVGGKDIVSSFHTHPNTGQDYLQAPSETDKRAVRDDPDLKGALYAGEFVISQERIYLIAPTGQVNEIGNTREILR